MRYVLEGTWTGYTSSQQRVVHREVVSKKRADRIRGELPAIQFTDGTSLILDVREALPRERVKEVNGYGSLIWDCLSLGVTDVIKIAKAKAERIAALRAKELS